jgi:hypothetical protein
MITTRTKNVAYIALLYCLLCLCVLTVTVYVTEYNKKKYATVRTQHAEAEATKQLATTVEQTLRLSEADRALLARFFIRERETINFIAEAENLATRFGLMVETTELSVTPPTDDVPSVLRIGFTTEGSYAAVTGLMAALETLPYHRTILLSTIKQTPTNRWEGTIVLQVTLQ